MNTHLLPSFVRMADWSPFLLVSAVLIGMAVAPQKAAARLIAPQDGLHLVDSLSPGNSDNAVLVGDAIYFNPTHRVNPRWVSSIDLDGNLLVDFSIGNNLPREIAVDESGGVFVMDLVTNSSARVRKYDSSGNLLFTLGPDPDDDSAVFDPANSTGVMRFSSETNRLYFAPLADLNPNSTLDRVYLNGAANNALIYVYETDGSLVRVIDASGILAPSLEDGIEDFHLVVNDEGIEELWVRVGIEELWVRVGDDSLRTIKVFTPEGEFKGLRTLPDNISSIFMEDGRLYASGSGSSSNVKILSLAELKEVGSFEPTWSTRFDEFLGKTSDGRFVGRWSGFFRVYSPALRTFFPNERNAIPDPFVSTIEQVAGTSHLRVRYKVTDPDDSTVETAALALADGSPSLSNVVPMSTFPDGLASGVLGTGVATGMTHEFIWDAGTDWNVDFGDISVVVLARDDRAFWFDTHLVEVPADGGRPAVTITRNPLEEHDFLMQWLWLIATNDASISLVDGIVFGVGGEWDGVQLTDAAGQTNAAGRAFLLARDGLRVATEAEVIRAREGATPGFTVEMNPNLQISPPTELDGWRRGEMPREVNEYGIESSDSQFSDSYDWRPGSDSLWHAVLDADES